MDTPTGPISAQLYASRIELVIAYLHNPKAWPDGIDEDWRRRHGKDYDPVDGIWFVGHEEFWIPLACTEQGRRDAQAELEAKAPKRKPLLPQGAPPHPTKGETSDEAKLRRNSFLKTADRLMQEAKKQAETNTVTKAQDKVDKPPREDKPAAAFVQEDPPRKKAGRPRARTPSAAALRKRRQRERK